MLRGPMYPGVERLLRISPSAPRLRQLARVDKDGAVRLRVAGKVFLPGGFLDDLAAFPENLDLFAVVGPEVIVQGLPTDRAANARLSVLREEKNNLAIEIKFLRLIGKRQ